MVLCKVAQLTYVLVLVLLHAFSQPASVLSVGPENHREKRFDSVDTTDFVRKEVFVLESDGVNVNAICVRAGPYKRSYGLFSSMGFPEQCSNGPCPPATAGEDFIPLNVDEFQPHPGLLECFNLTIINDALAEGREFFLVGLLDHRTGAIRSLARVTILDDDSPQLFDDSDVVSESIGLAEFCLQGGSVDLELRVVAGTEDVGVNSPLITIHAGDVECVNLTVVDDIFVEEGFERVPITLTSVNITVGVFNETFMLLIADNDVAPMFEQSSYTVSEGDGDVEVCVVYDSRGIVPVDVTITPVEDTAKNGDDFFASEMVLNGVGPGIRRCRTIQIMDDLTAEREETFTLRLRSVLLQIPTFFTATVTITDDDIIDFQMRQYFTSEDQPSVEVCVGIVSQEGTQRGYIVSEAGTARGIPNNRQPCVFPEEKRRKRWYHNLPCIEDVDFISLRPQFFSVSNSQTACFSILNHDDSSPETREEYTVRVYTLAENTFHVLDSRTAQVFIDDDDVTCSSLPAPANGSIIEPIVRSFGSKVVYFCHTGFRLIGDNTRTCIAGEMWSGSEPTCLDEVAVGTSLSLRLVNKSPSINRRTLTLDVLVTGPTDQLTYTIDNILVEKQDIRKQSPGRMVVTNILPGPHTLKLTLSSLISTQTISITRRFEIGHDKSFCALHLVDDGDVVSGFKYRVEFGAVPEIGGYTCSLDDSPTFECISPVELDVLKPGPHQLIVSHPDEGCGQRRPLFLPFNIENTPDNPFNNV